jgi:Helix-turn-helix domain
LPNPHPRPWRRGSVFGPGLRRPLCREQRAQWRAKLLLSRRPGGLTQAAVAVGRVLLDLLGQDGRLDPCIDTLARLARVHTATVVRALAQLRAAGFLAWTRRLAREGWRAAHGAPHPLLMPPHSV